MAETGTTASLELVGSVPNKVGLTPTGELETPDGVGFHPSSNLLDIDYRLVTQDGARFDIDGDTQELKRITDLDGNYLQVSNLSAATFDPTGQLIAELRWHRDNAGRIDWIEDPSGERLEYSYENGDLVSFKNRADEETTYQYDTKPDGMPLGEPHFLTSIVGPDGVTAMQAIFAIDPIIQSGGVVFKGLVDGSGQALDVDYGGGVTFDDGRVLETTSTTGDGVEVLLETTTIYDLRGNPERVIRLLNNNHTPAYEVTYYTYNKYDQLLRQSFAQSVDGTLAHAAGVEPNTLGVVDPRPSNAANGVWSLVNTYYPGGGNLKTTTDAAGITTTYTYNGRNEIRSVSSTNGQSSTTEYVDRPSSLGGRGITTRTDLGDGREQVTTTVTNRRGQVERIVQQGDNGEIIETAYTYAANGLLISTTDARGQSRHFNYDSTGRQTHSWSHVTVNGATKTIVSVSAYDQEGRVLGSGQLTLDGKYGRGEPGGSDLQALVAAAPASTGSWGTQLDQYTLTQYDDAGRVETTTDRFGNVSHSYYNTRGLLVESATQAQEWDGSAYKDVWLVSRTHYDTLGRATHQLDTRVVQDTDSDHSTYERPTELSGYGTKTTYDLLGRAYRIVRFSDLKIELDTHQGHTHLLESSIPSDPTAAVSFSETQYSDEGRTLATISAAGAPGAEKAGTVARSDYYYDAAGRQSAILGPETTIAGQPRRVLTQFTYDTAGRQETVTTGIAFDHAGLADHPDFASLQDATKRDLNVARTTEYDYDILGRITETTQRGDESTLSDDLTSETHYDTMGRRDYVVDALGRQTDYVYDATGRLTDVVLPKVDPLGVLNGTANLTQPRYHYDYDAYGNQTSITDPIGTSTAGDLSDRVTTFAYDHMRRQIGRTLPEGMSESMTYYDADNAAAGEYYGLLKETIDFEGRVTTFVYDNFGRLNTKTYYDSVNEQTANNPARIVNYKYDALGRPVEVNDSGHGVGGGLTTTKYDAEGRTTQIDSPEGVLNYEYDDLGRMIRTFTTPTAASTDAVSDTRYSYDALGRLTGVTMVERNNAAVQGKTVTWNGTSITGEHTSYAYDAVGNLELTEQTNHDGISAHTVSMKYTYDAFNHLTDLHHFVDGDGNQTADNGEWIASFHYDLDTVGNRTQAEEKFDLDGDGSFDAGQGNGGVDLLQTFNWLYDGLNRLVEERFDLGSNGTTGGNSFDDADYIARYAFDLASNRQQLLKDLGNAIAANFIADETIDYTYDENDRLLTEQKSGTSTEYTEYAYGPNVDIASDYGGDHTTQTRKAVYTDSTKTTPVSDTTFSYDATGRQTQVVEKSYDSGSLTGTKTTDYTYSDQGLRIAESNGTDTTTYLFDPQNHTGYAQVTQEYINGTLAKVSTLGHDIVVEAVVSGGGSGTPYTFVYDGHGSTRVLLDADAAIAEMQTGPGILQVFSYDAYGKMLDQSAITVASKALASAVVEALTANLYSGEHTNANGVQYLRARWYDPSSGQFNRLDPFGGNTSDPLSLHKYLYAHGNPVMNADPTGRFALVATLATLSVGAFLQASLIPPNLASAARGAQSQLASYGYQSSSPFQVKPVSVLGDRLSLTSAGHFVLDVLGLIPVVGVVFDSANAIWYAAEGEYTNAAISAVAAIPGAGYIAAAATGSKWLGRGSAYADIGINLGFSAVAIVKGIQDENYLVFAFGLAGAGANTLFAIKLRGGSNSVNPVSPTSRVVSVPGTGDNLGGAAFRAPDGTVYVGIHHGQVADWLYEQRIWTSPRQPDNWDYGLLTESGEFLN